MIILKTKVNIYFLCVALAAALWGTAGIFVRAIEKTAISEMQIVLGRALFSTLIIGFITLIKDPKLFKIKLKDLWLFAASGIFSIVLFNFSYYTTMSLTSLSVAAVLLYTAPFFVVIISLFLFKEKLTLNKSAACIIAFLGCCLVSGLFDSAHRISGKALFFGLLTGFGYALYTVFGELLIKRGYHTLTITFYVFLTATVGTVPFIDFKGTASAVSSQPMVMVIILLMAVVNTVIPYLLYTTGLKGVEPSVAPIIATIEPVVATVVGAALFKEPLTLWGFFGILLVLASVVILNLKLDKKSVEVKANAKINLVLDITGKREDGYHSIDTVMQSLDLADIITVSKADKVTVDCGIAELNNENNIAYRATSLFFEAVGIDKGAEIKIQKHIPQAGGLGGGSADAAAVLLALKKLYKTKLTEQQLREIAVKLGADVPFFIKGGTQRAEGIGEVLTSLKPLENGYFLLIKQGNKPSTGEMYARLDSENPPHSDVEACIKAIEENDLNSLAKYIDNSFISVNREFALKEKLLGMGAIGISLSGSGPTWFAVFDDFDKAETAFNDLKAETECYLTKPCNNGIKFE